MPAQPVVTQSKPLFAVGVVLLFFGTIGWLMGSKYSVIGWHDWLNHFLTWLSLPVQIPTIVGWWWLVVFPVGFLYSRVEVTHRPFGRQGGIFNRRYPPTYGWYIDPLPYWVAWIVIVGTDVGSTFAGIQVPDATVWGPIYPLMTQVANSQNLSAGFSFGLTFIPEMLILAGLACVRISRRR